MEYSKEVIAQTPNPNQEQPVTMREEKVLDPYKPARAAKLLNKAEQATGQSDKVGSEAVADTTKTEETVTLSPGAAALARKEQKVRQEEARLKKEKEDLEAKKADIAKLEAMKAKLEKKDFSDLESIVDYDAYTQYLLSKQTTQTPEQEALKKLTQEIEGLKKSNEETISKQFEAAVKERKDAAAKLLESDPDFKAFGEKVAKAMPKVQLNEVITQHILDTWEHDEVELSVEQASKEVREAILAKAKIWSSLVAEETKATAETQPDPAGAPEKKTLPPMKPSLKTITNQVTAGDTKRAKPNYSMMKNDQERWEAARQKVMAEMNQQKAQ